NNNVILSDDAVLELAKPVTKKEVFDALMNMKSYKAPGPDGFQPIFFKLFWQDVGDDMWKFVKSAFENGRYDKKICETLVVLLPKGDTQTSFKDFRPISLCNVTYKLVSKIIVSRLRPFLDGIDTLEKFKFPTRIISLIMFGIKASSNTILWNGSKTEPFSPMRGLRQGDPLSPYLFVLCMERLGTMISSSVSNGSWKPMQITKDGTKLSHLFFADDVLLFAKANVSQARVVNNVLERFCALSGLKISLDKSKFCTSTGVCRRLRDTIAATTQIHATDRFDKYLGFKMFYGKVRKQDFNDIYDRVSAKLASWKGRLLNKPGRVVLANSVISALPSYHMQIHWLPQGMCDDLDRIVRKFIWKGTGGSGMHLVGWNKITQPRRYGGLGVRIARIQNVFLLGKLVWEILNSPSKLWVTLFAEKYLKGRLIFNVSVAGGSLIWNSIAKALRMLQDGFWFKIGDGNTNFWFEPRLYKERLSTAVPFVAIQDTDLNIKDVWYNNRWNLETLYTILPDDVKTAILELKPHVVTDLPDVWVWNNASSGIFSPKDAYEWLLQPQPIYNHSNWKWIWQLRLPANIQFLYSQFLYIICLHFTE
ncbi:RNA-directed DNA polymerase (Reverse transcriptase), partial [Trifolium medium]|nr:RNA-directed DNA polymerase (Reverse transcriptase) [Trifolium medium]